MGWGMKNRLSRLIRPDDGRAVWLAIDHGYFLGPLSKLEEPGKTVKPLLPFTDAIMLTRGVLRNCISADIKVPIILRVSGGNSIAGPALSNEGIHTCMEDAIRLNASAVAFSIYVGTEHEHQTLLSLGQLVNEGQRYGIPVLAVTAVGKELEKRDARYLGLCCRIAAELGAGSEDVLLRGFRKSGQVLSRSFSHSGRPETEDGTRRAQSCPRRRKGRSQGRGHGAQYLAVRKCRRDDKSRKFDSP